MDPEEEDGQHGGVDGQEEDQERQERHSEEVEEDASTEEEEEEEDNVEFEPVDEESDVEEDNVNLMDAENWQEERLRIYVEGGAVRDPSSDEEEEAQPEEDAQRFDTDLPRQHSYLGEGHEVSGRTVLDEDQLLELVIFPHPSVILMPGQTLPLTLLMPQHIAVAERLIATTKTFGSLYVRTYHDDDFPSEFKEAPIGTTAEIFEYRDSRESNTEIGFKIKVKGRQRFKVLSWRQQVDGTRLATVEILRETKLAEPMYDIRLRSRDRFRLLPVGVDEEEEAIESGGDESGSSDSSSVSSARRKRTSSTSRLRNSLSELMGRLKGSGGGEAKARENKQDFMPKRRPYLKSRRNHLRTCIYSTPLTAHPNWVYEQYDANILAERVHELLASLKLYSHTHLAVPDDPVDLSYWVATNLPISNVNRLRLLEMNCAVSRLQTELQLLRRGQHLVCRRCDEPVGKQGDLFSMSAEGPQGAYVNSHGYTHETLTLYRATGLHLRGLPSTEYSWFPGYAWTIAECKSCNGHMGWKFTATNRKLVPKKFWGISRQSVRPQMEVESNMADLQEPPMRDEDGEIMIV